MKNREIKFYIAKQLKSRRKKIGLTQDDLSHLLDLNRVSVVNIEKARQGLTVENLLQLCAIFNCQYSDLLPPIKPMKRKYRWVEKTVKVPKIIKVRKLTF